MAKSPKTVANDAAETAGEAATQIPAEETSETAVPEPVVEPPADPAPKDKPYDLEVTARTEGYRRAGIRFGKTPLPLIIADLSEAQQEAIAGDPLLTLKFL